TVNGRPVIPQREGGYASIRRRWMEGDTVELKLAMRLRAEPVRDDANLVALMQGPMVMAADLGSAGDPFDFEAPVPALVGATTADVVSSIGGSTNTGAATQPPNLPLKPFF